MDPVLKVWLFEQWLGDQRDNTDLAKNHAYLVGSFWNPEAVKQLMNTDIHKSTDEEFEESSRMVREANLKMLDQEQSKGKRKKRLRAQLKQQE